MRLWFMFMVLAVQGHAMNITVDNYGWPGATASMITSRVLDTETTASHHDIWIVEGGLNDLNYSCGNYRYAQEQITSNWLQVQALADRLGVTVYFSEITPIAPGEDPICSWAPCNPKIELLNLRLAVMALDYKIKTISLFSDLEQHWTKTADAWCLNLANNGKIDGAHPNALGAQAIAEHYYSDIRSMLVQTGPKTIAIFGDSIVATTYLPPDQRIDAKMRLMASMEVSAAPVSSWMFYK